MSSDSSEDENLDLLREAVDYQFFNDSMFKEKASDSVIERSESSKKDLPPSLRKTEDEDEQFNLFRVTPEFRNYVAKQLSKLLDEKLEKLIKSVKNVNDTPKKKRQKSGVKLFSNSESFLKVGKRAPVDNVNTTVATSSLTKKYLSYRHFRKSFEEINEQSLQETVVKPEDILSKKDTKFWSNRSKAPVFHYKKSSDGSFQLIEAAFK